MLLLILRVRGLNKPLTISIKLRHVIQHVLKLHGMFKRGARVFVRGRVFDFADHKVEPDIKTT